MTMIHDQNGQAITSANPLPTQLMARSVTDATLQNAASASGNGTAFSPTNGNNTLTFEVKGTSTSRTVVFEIAGPSGTYAACLATRVTDFAQATQTTGGSDTAPESWQVDVPAGWSFRARVSAVAGGNVSVVGKAVI